MVGSMGAAFSTISGNVVHDINMRNMLGGAEMAGIKIHAPVDSLISHNHVYRCGGGGGIWLDWMTQGTRVTGNLLHDNQRRDLHSEVKHGPYLVDNNLFFSAVNLEDSSTGGAYVHNLFAGAISKIRPQGRKTPYFKPHSTEIAGLHVTHGGDNRFLNNLFLGGHNLDDYANMKNMVIEGNHFAQAEPRLIQNDDGIYRLEFKSDLEPARETQRELVSSQALGTTVISGLPFKLPGGDDFIIDKDYFGNPRDRQNPAAGPFNASTKTPVLLK